MRRTGTARLLPAAVLAAALLLGAAPRPSAANIDLVVMVDTSESMFPYFDDLMNYLVQTLLTEKLHRGDTFHLLSFSSVPEVELSLEVNSDEAAQSAFGRILLLHALGRYTDLVRALQFLSTYTRELPETNPKQIILITDGVHDPPPGSPDRGNAEAVATAIDEAVKALNGQGWTFSILRVPPETAPGEQGTKSYLPGIAQALGVPIVPYRAGDQESTTGRTTGFPDLVFPAGLGNVGNRFTAPFRVKNWKNEPIIVRLSAVQSDGVDLLDRRVSITVAAGAEAALDVPMRLPASYPQGDHEAAVRLVFEDDIRISPTEGTLAFTFTGRGGIPVPRITFLYGVYIVAGLAVLYLLVRLFLLMRNKLGDASAASHVRGKLGAAGGTAVGAAGGPRGRGGAAGPRAAEARSAVRGGAGRKTVPLLGSGDPAAGEAPAGSRRRERPTVTSIRRSLPRRQMQQPTLPPLIEMRVDQQNHRIGFRNVHRIAPGSARSVGGRFSAFLVFLVPIPASIGTIRCDDGHYTFTPVREDLFPGLEGPLEDCLEVDIPFLTPRGREMSLRFREWVSPLEEINRLLRMPAEDRAKGIGGR